MPSLKTDSRSEGGSEFLSDKLLDLRAEMVPGAPYLTTKQAQLLIQALAYIVADVEYRNTPTTIDESGR